MSEDFTTRLTQRIRSGMGPVVVGLDPRPEALPVDLAPGQPPAARILAFHRLVLPALAPRVPAVKPNIAFYERHGADGFAAYEQTCHLARELGLVVIGDIKRGDIGSTAAAYAEFHLGITDAVTVHPYLGIDSIQPFLDHCRRKTKAIFVLVRTSNPSATELQDLPSGDQRFCEAVARAVDRWGRQHDGDGGYSAVGAVVGATRPDDITVLRKLMPRAWFLLPGVGAQGASIADCAEAFDDHGLGGLVHQSRGVTQCFERDDPDWLQQVERAAEAFSREAAAVAQARTGSPPS